MQTKISKLDVVPDPLDFRDLMFTSTLCEVPVRRPLETFLGEFENRKSKVQVLSQGHEGACTGFGLAAVIHFLLGTRAIVPDCEGVSPRMLYEMAKRHDEWPKEDYEGSSCRGAMKGWHKHGVCSQEMWKYRSHGKDRTLTQARAENALKRPLGAYFRVNHKDLVAMHAAIAEAGILYASANVHSGWADAFGREMIPAGNKVLGGHAFAIVGYDADGFWIQNSWGTSWGKGGFACLSYDDWLRDGMDVWVARLGVPINTHGPQGIIASAKAGQGSVRTYSQADLMPHVISLKNNGLLQEGGTFGQTAADVKGLIQNIPTFARRRQWKGTKRILLYAHGGLVAETTALQRLAEYRDPMLANQVYPLSLIWRSDLWSTISNILQDAVAKRRPEGIVDAAKDFMLDRIDDLLEPIARTIGGKAFWGEMKENALLASAVHDRGRAVKGGALLAAEQLKELCDKHGDYEVHLVGHSAGSIMLGGLLQAFKKLKVPVASCTLWAPAITVKLFEKSYLPALQSGTLRKLAIFTLSEGAELDDCCEVNQNKFYFKSLLYLVSNAFEDRLRVPFVREGEPVLGMAKFLKPLLAYQTGESPSSLHKLSAQGRIDWVLGPSSPNAALRDRSQSRHHGDFDDDPETLKSTLARILDDPENSLVTTEFEFSRSMTGLRSMHRSVAQAAGLNAPQR